MKVLGKHYRTIWLKPQDPRVVQIIDQRTLPYEFTIEDITTVEEMARAIKEMHVRGAGLIGAAAGYGMYLAALEAPLHSGAGFLGAMEKAGALLMTTRPTAVNLAWAVERQLQAMAQATDPKSMPRTSLEVAQAIADEDANFCRRIGEHGLPLLKAIGRKKNKTPVNILTHCNAGWLAFVDHGTATAPIYAAFDAGISVHVWVDETRPRNQGAQLTAWELSQHGVPHTIICDNVGGHLMQHGLVDLVLTGTDRTLVTGDVANKIGTYLKALAAFDNQIPFYVALPSSSFDWQKQNGLLEIPIEERDADEVCLVAGLHEGKIKKVQITPTSSPVANYAFDVTPARLVTGLITERGICKASEEGVLGLYPEKKAQRPGL